MRDTLTIDGITYHLTSEQKAEYARLRAIWEAEIVERGEPEHEDMTLDAGRDPYKDITDRFRASVRRMLGIHDE
ncbi:MAG: hypothetical protein SOI26_05525 [Coriobacteriales bacterium]|jgi:DNA-binding PadR family transcriptional regulator